MKKKKLQLKDLQVKSFVTSNDPKKDLELNGGVTGNCLSDLYTCEAGCDFESVPLNECTGWRCVGATLLIGITCVIIYE